MKLVLDTDVIAASLLAEPARGEEADRLLARGFDLFAPAHWKAELCNVLWKTARLGRLAAGQVDTALSLAESLPIASIEVGELWRGALARAIASGHPAYDTLFIELAARLGTQVVSYDRPLKKRFPEHVREPLEVLRT